MTESCCDKEELTVETKESTVLSEVEFNLDKENYAQQRLEICKQCPNLVGPLNNCLECGCFMNIKVRIYSANCPIGKW